MTFAAHADPEAERAEAGGTEAVLLGSGSNPNQARFCPLNFRVLAFSGFFSCTVCEHVQVAGRACARCGGFCSFQPGLQEVST